MRLNQYSSKRELRPAFPAEAEIKKTTQAWKGERPDKQETVKYAKNNVTKALEAAPDQTRLLASR